MTKRNWKKQHPRDIRHAMKLCLEHAQEVHRRSADRVAELMGLKSVWTLYKWMESGRIPGVVIPAFEHACGIDFVTQYLAGAAHKLLLSIPSGSAGGEAGVADLNESFAAAIGLLSKFYRNAATAEDTLAALDHAMRATAWHRVNVAKQEAPELALFMEGDE
jgi:hypothetical protein